MEISLTIMTNEETLSAFQKHLLIKSTNPPNSINSVDFTDIQKQLLAQLEKVHPIIDDMIS